MIIYCKGAFCMPSTKCMCCPRMCGIDRSLNYGFCKSNNNIKIAKAYLHQWEEPCLSKKNGAGTVFFSGCNLRCVYCQNYKISNQNFGKTISVDRLAEIFIELQDKGASNIELVTPTHYVLQILKALDKVKNRLVVPVVYNCGGYELPDIIKMLNGYIDVYLPDIKYFSDTFAARYSSAADYFSYASESVKEMISQCGKLSFDADGSIIKGTIIRHLVLPGLRKDSMNIIKWIADNLPADSYLLSLMSQYTPTPFVAEHFPELNRRITKMEYFSVLNYAADLGINGFSQSKTSAVSDYTPDFDLSGV